MLKLVFIVITFIIHLDVFSQGDRAAGLNVPCTNEIAQGAQGRWIQKENVSREGTREVNANLLKFHRLVTEIYPQPTGVDAAWHLYAGISYFGEKIKLNTNRDGVLRREAVDLAHVTKFYYNCGFFAYTCDYSDKSKMIVQGETSTWLKITANEASTAIGGVADQLWFINDLPVRLKQPVLKSLGDHELQQVLYGGNARYVLIHRKGVLPYIPVTRKQYLDQCLIYFRKLYDEQIAGLEKLPVRSLEEQEKEKQAKLAQYEKQFEKDPKRKKSAVDYYLSGYKTDQQARDEQVEKVKKIKVQELKKYTDELEKTTQQGLLDSPAMIRVMYTSDHIFETDPLLAYMLIVENPAYIRKDLPKHVPQLIEVMWTWNNWAPQEKLAAIIEASNLFDKLQGLVQ